MLVDTVVVAIVVTTAFKADTVVEVSVFGVVCLSVVDAVFVVLRKVTFWTPVLEGGCSMQHFNELGHSMFSSTS